MRAILRAVAPLVLSLAVPLLDAAEPRAIDAGYSRQTAWSTGDTALDRLQDLLRPTLEANRKELVGRTGPVKAFGAGAAYPQVWLRDSATVMPLARYHYPAAYLTSWLEEHLANQAADGGLDDWIAAGPPSAFVRDAPRARQVFRAGAAVLTADKNTVEADQESSAVRGVCQAFRATGDRAWLRKPIAGVALLDRTDRALEFLLAKRFDARLGLVTSGFSADWGDVSPVYGDQRAIYLDERTPRVAGLYTNAMFADAARCLGDLHAEMGDAAGWRRWRDAAAGVAAAVGRHLWQEARGFYGMHVPLAATGMPDDSRIFAMGGNAVALLSGIGDESRARRILAAATSRRKRYGVSTIAGTVLPPYPAGLFAHPALREPWSYQNGGQWDWFGARLVLAAFRHGHSALARRWLDELAQKADRNGGLHEWHTRDGQGRGSPTYAGSAGALGAAAIEGLFGVSLSADVLALTIRLGELPGRIHLYQPATDTFVAYRYEPSGQALALTYDSNHSRPGRVALRVPAGRQVLRITLDGKPAAFRATAVGDDRFVTIDTAWGPHRLQVALGHPAGAARPRGSSSRAGSSGSRS
jgi:mannosylglycerate hydrolase MGH1-like protein